MIGGLDSSTPVWNYYSLNFVWTVKPKKCFPKHLRQGLNRGKETHTQKEKTHSAANRSRFHLALMLFQVSQDRLGLPRQKKI